MSGDRPGLILASASEIRAKLLSNAGISFRIDPAHIDEAEVRRACQSRGDAAAEAAMQLAAAKAEAVASRHPGALVLGADQLLECEGIWMGKAHNLAEARDALLFLRRRSHRLISGAAIVGGGQTHWRHAGVATLTMRDFSDAFLDRYLAMVGRGGLTSVGGYMVEGLGIQLFASMEGDHFTILGLPLLAVLAYLRSVDLLPQ